MIKLRLKQFKQGNIVRLPLETVRKESVKNSMETIAQHDTRPETADLVANVLKVWSDYQTIAREERERTTFTGKKLQAHLQTKAPTSYNLTNKYLFRNFCNCSNDYKLETNIIDTITFYLDDEKNTIDVFLQTHEILSNGFVLTHETVEKLHTIETPQDTTFLDNDMINIILNGCKDAKKAARIKKAIEKLEEEEPTINNLRKYHDKKIEAINEAVRAKISEIGENIEVYDLSTQIGIIEQ